MEFFLEEGMIMAILFVSRWLCSLAGAYARISRDMLAAKSYARLILFMLVGSEFMLGYRRVMRGLVELCSRRRVMRFNSKKSHPL